MIPKKDHIAEIERFHNMVTVIDNSIKDNPRDFEALAKYFELTSKIWPIVDDAIEEIKDALDEFELANPSWSCPSKP